MSPPPSQPQIYHITHVDNLQAIIDEGALVSDSEMVRRGGPAQGIGMSSIKQRRMVHIDVDCHPGTKVGDYVPFYFCPRSVMLFVIYKQNHPELRYRGGQDPIIHLEADLHAVVQWAAASGRRWAFSLLNAGAYYVKGKFRSSLQSLADLDWEAIAARDFSTSSVKEGKQAEFLSYEIFPFDLVQRIGVRSTAMHARVSSIVSTASHQPQVELRPEWYF